MLVKWGIFHHKKGLFEKLYVLKQVFYVFPEGGGNGGSLKLA